MQSACPAPTPASRGAVAPRRSGGPGPLRRLLGVRTDRSACAQEQGSHPAGTESRGPPPAALGPARPPLWGPGRPDCLLPPDRAICTVSGDPHYTTFDGRLFHFMGTCTYLLAAVCNASAGLPAFRVEASNEHRGASQQVSYLKSVRVEVHGSRVELLKGRRVNVDGRRVALPVSLAGGRVSVSLSGTFVLLQADFGLRVRFDGNHHADISVPSSFAGQLCGLCGEEGSGLGGRAGKQQDAWAPAGGLGGQGQEQAARGEGPRHPRRRARPPAPSHGHLGRAAADGMWGSEGSGQTPPQSRSRSPFWWGRGTGKGQAKQAGPLELPAAREGPCHLWEQGKPCKAGKGVGPPGTPEGLLTAPGPAGLPLHAATVFPRK
ncbi:Zonadhesin [Varanus komodoensis]|nr:Zonadhesin [Varanus komodoensis]